MRELGDAMGCRLRGAGAAGLVALTLIAPAPMAGAEDGSPAGLVRLSDRAWAWVAEDDRSSNGALLVGSEAALVVDPGLTPAVVRRFLAAVREVTDRPVRWAVLTHWHPDHALGAVCVASEGGRSFELAAHPKTRRALAEHGARARAALAAEAGSEAERGELEACRIVLPERGIAERETFELGDHRVEVFHPGAGHTQGDLVVWSPAERVLATGDLFLHDSCPYMGEGGTRAWLEALDALLALEPAHVIPGHFAPGRSADLGRFRDYLTALIERAEAGLAAGKSAEEIAAAMAREGMPAFAGFAQYPQYEATFADNLRVVAEELARRPARPGEAAGFTVRKVLDVGQAPHQISFSADGKRAYVAAAGSDRITEVDAVRLEATGSRKVSDTPLGVVELPSGDLAVTHFRGDGIVRLPAAGGPAAAELNTGGGTSLLIGPVPGLAGEVLYLASTEQEDRLRVLDAGGFELVVSYPTGRRPFPPAATSDGRKAFVPGYGDGSLTVVDLWNRRVVATVPVGERPSGGAVLPGDLEVAVAVRGENRLVFVDTASHRVVAELRQGIGEGPFSVVVAPDGALAFVNNTASHDVSVILLREGERRVVARVPTGEIPIVMAVHPSGETLWVGCEGSHELYVIDIPRELRAAVETAVPDPPPEVAVLGMIHGGHRGSELWGLEQVRQTVQRFAPEVVCAEIPPDRWQRIWTDWSERGVIEDERVKVFPEITDVLLPLAVEMGFRIEPCAAWTREMAELRRARLEQFRTDPALAAEHAAYERENAEIEARHRRQPMVEDDPRVIHSELYDRRTREALEPYDRVLGERLGPGGWTSINEAHYRLIDGVLRRHRGERILIAFGAGHKHWFLERLSRRDDIRLLDVEPYLPGPRGGEPSSTTE